MDAREVRTLLGDVQVLVELARTGTVTGAADELGIPQPSASRAIARLAERVGTPLTARAGRGVELTEAGRALADAGADALETLHDGLAAARTAAEPADALVAVAYQTALGESFLPRALARHRQRRPGVRFRLVHGARTGCLDAVRSGSVDVAVVADPLHEPGLRTEALYSEPLFLVVARAHPLAALGRPARPEDFAGEELIALGRGFGLHDSIRRIAGERAATGAFEVDDYRIARGLAAAGAGVTILPAGSPGDDDAVEVPIAHPAARRVIGAVTAVDASAATDDLVQSLQAVARYRWRLGA
ncbi:LysR family transcriptional regulator [Schumannella sp. 10F1B-5-1]|uniref:LysR family transcriptional regulator n=1 Tax=Schumannella sp. 10F1B-5-1 TaxID=2590780 RepID=UPI00112FE04B|nr:LysR family transcriptional regulator [Schumannella sp. 10F1B-5-1]TPW78373.1 LysR family transcriptional regulator [Schumannella sp. 10F1B-5-1]